MPYEITQCYLPPGRGDFPAFTTAEASTRFSDPGGIQGWVDLDVVCTPWCVTGGALVDSQPNTSYFCVFYRHFRARNYSLCSRWQADMERADQLRVSGQALIGCGQYAVDCVQPKCAELERICTEFTAHFNYRRSRLRDAHLIWRAILHVRNASQPRL